MKPSGDPPDSSSNHRSVILSGPPDLRYYPAHRLIAWQPTGSLDDVLLDILAGWLYSVENVSPPFKRFVDLSRLTTVAVRTRHVFEFARRRAAEFRPPESVRTALFSQDWVSFGIACMYEALMQETQIETRAFRNRADAAEWLDVAEDVLSLADEPARHTGPDPLQHV